MTTISSIEGQLDAPKHPTPRRMLKIALLTALFAALGLVLAEVFARCGQG